MNTAATTTLRVKAGGRIVIPAQVRKQLGLQVGTSVILRLQADHATLMTVRAARQQARRRVRRYVRNGVSLSGELMAERKLEARHE
jgi:AbrB family looped-hinge helix DNA binding protein